MDHTLLNGEAKLSNSTLKESLECAYAEFSAVLLGLGVPPTRHLYEVELAGIVFDVAIGSNWIPLIPDPDDDTPASARTHGRTLVQFGDFEVERWYVDAFMELLRDEIAFSSSYGPETDRPDRLHGLPRFTSQKERDELLQAFLERNISESKRPKMIQVADWAGVDYADFKKWRRGPAVLKDSSLKSKRIAMLLRYDDKSQAKRPKFRD